MTAISIYFSQNVACIFVSILLLRDEIIITATNQSYVFFLNKKFNELLMTLNISLHKDLKNTKQKKINKKKTQVRMYN